MAAGPLTKVADVVVPQIYSPYIQQESVTKSLLVQSGALVRDPLLDQFLQGGGLLGTRPSFRDLDDDAENIATDAVADSIAWTQLSGTAVGANYPTLNDSTPVKIQTSAEIYPRLTRNQSWSHSDLASELAGSDPGTAIANKVAGYWRERFQRLFIAIWNGVIKDNVANDAGDYQNDVSGAGFVEGVTNFTTAAFYDALATRGDSMGEPGLIAVHPTVYTRMLKQNLVFTIPDSQGRMTRDFQGFEILVDEDLPKTGNVYDTWIFGAGATSFGAIPGDGDLVTERIESAGNGNGQEILYSRVGWVMHPNGHSYVGTSPNGGPGNGTGANDFNAAASWNRVYPKRKQIRFARLVTREA